MDRPTVGKRTKAAFVIKDNLKRMSKVLHGDKGAYESFVLKGVIPEMSCFSAAVIVYQSMKVMFGLIYAVNILPEITLYHVTSSAILLLYLPPCVTVSQKCFRLQVYMRCVMALQIIWLITGSVFVYYRYHYRYTPEIDSVIYVTGVAIGIEWVFVVVTMVTRGMAAVVFLGFVILVESVVKLIYKILFKNKNKEKPS